MAEEKAAAESPNVAAQIAMSASSEEAREYLRRQSRLTDLQIEDLKREDELRHWSLIVHHFSDVLKLAFEFAVAAICARHPCTAHRGAVWSAAHDDGLVIEAFSVPPDLAQVDSQADGRGAASGQLSAMQTDHYRRGPRQLLQRLGQRHQGRDPEHRHLHQRVYRYLVAGFGNQTHISGEVFVPTTASRSMCASAATRLSRSTAASAI